MREDAMMHAVVESQCAVRGLRAHLGDRPVVWHTTSPYLLSALRKEGEDVRSLEEGLDQDLMDGLAKAGVELGAELGARLNETCAWRDYADLELAYGGAVSKLFFSVLYKGMLLDRLADGLGEGGELVCVGQPLAEARGLDLTLGRLETLYFGLASRAGLQTFECAVSDEEKARVEDAVKYGGKSVYKRVLSLLNVSLSASLVKLARRAVTSRRLPLRQVTLNPFSRKRFTIYKHCELLDDAFLGLLLRGARFGFMDSVPARVRGAVGQGGADSTVRAMALDAVATKARAAGLDVREGGAVEAACALVADRIAVSVARLEAAMPELGAGFGRIVDELGPKPTILSNCLASIEERLFFRYCDAHGVRVAAFEHGVTLGLSDWSEWGARHFPMRSAHVGAYHNRQGMAEIAPYVPKQRRILAGTARITSRIRLRALQRRIVRRWFGLSGDRPVVLYLAKADRNNHVYGPHSENDLQFYESTREIIGHLAEAHPHCVVLVKLYPTQRYADEYNFEDVCARHANVRLFKDVDMRFIRAVADVVYLSSSQSTLGYALGSGLPCVHIDYSWSRSRLDGFACAAPQLAGVHAIKVLVKDAAIIPDRDYRELYAELLA